MAIFEPYGINDLLEIRVAAAKALRELDRALREKLMFTKRIVCFSCGEIDAVSFSSEPDEFDWDEKSQTYELASNLPEQSSFSCTKCGLPVCAEIDGDHVVPVNQEDLLEGRELA